MCGRYSPALEQHHRPQQRLRVQHRRRDHVHRVLCEPEDAPRRAVRRAATIVRAALARR